MSAVAKPMFYVMTDEEFQEYHKDLKKQKLLDDMMAASATKSFSSKSVRRPTTNPTALSEPAEHSNITPFQPIQTDEGESKLHISDDEWSQLLSGAFTADMSPIKKVTETEMQSLTLDDVDMGELDASHPTYKNMYKKELAMLAEVLKDATSQSEVANAIIKQLTDNGKKLRLNGGSGISKLFPDLLSSANATNQTRRSIIKDMADLKKSAADFELKRLKEEGANEGENVNSTANAFFGQIVGDRKRFIESAMASAMGPTPQYSSQPQSGDEYAYDDNSYDNDNREQSSGGGLNTFNLTAPLDGYGELYDDEYGDSDPHGYLRNEGRDVSVCIQMYGDGRLEFVALDSDGELVEDYELPDDELLESINIRPTSNYAQDMEGRRYRVIRLNEPLDISDV